MIDYVLAALLIVAMPALAVYRSLRSKSLPTNRPRRYIQASWVIVGLLVLLAFAWLHGARLPAALGLGVPLTARGWNGMVIAAVLFFGLVVGEVIAKVRHRDADEDKAIRRLANDNALPRTRHELALFMVFGLLAGCGWELLYRGFLMWFLTPRLGVIAAVCVAALAYGSAHGYKSRIQLLASIASAFAFTIAFVLTASLWWLMFIHTGMAIVGGLGSYRLASRHPDLMRGGTEVVDV